MFKCGGVVHLFSTIRQSLEFGAIGCIDIEAVKQLSLGSFSISEEAFLCSSLSITLSHRVFLRFSFTPNTALNMS